MNDELYKKIEEIIDKRPSENAWLDYKEKFYDYKNTNKKAEIIKDICAFLNSIDGYGMDKFIIFGIKDKSLERVGINRGKFPDDNNIREFTTKIFPRPSVFLGVYHHKDGNDYGYMCMPAALNDDRVYNITTNYPSLTTAQLLDPSQTADMNFVLKGVTYIRWASTTEVLTEYDRRRIYDVKKKNIILSKADTTTLNDIDKIDILKKIALIGCWNENNENDRKLISNFLNMDYSAISTILKSYLKQYSDFITYDAGIWNIIDKENILVNYGDNYHEDDFNNYYDLLLNVYKSINTKFELDKKQRILASYYEKGSKYSSELRMSLLDTLLIFNHRIEIFKNIKNKVKSLKYSLIETLIDFKNWQSIASNFDIMHFLAEFSPELFIEFADRVIEDEDVKLTLINESEEFIVPTNYLNNISDSLIVIARMPEFCLDSLKVLIKYSDFNKDIINQIGILLMPLHPQVNITAEKRVSLLRKLYKVNKNQTFEILKELLPSGIRYSYDLPDFKYEKIGISPDVTNQDYYNEEIMLIKSSFEYFDIDEKFIELFVKELFFTNDLIYQFIYEQIKEIIKNKLSQQNKYALFNFIKDELAFKKKIDKNDEDWNNKIKDLEELIIDLNLSEDLISRRYFDANEWNLNDEFANEDKDLNNYRSKIVEKIYRNENFSGILSFIANISFPYKVGEILAEKMEITAEENDQITKMLDGSNKKRLQFASGYYHIKLMDYSDEQINELCTKLNNNQKIHIFLQLPNTLKYWKLIEKNVRMPKKYWENNNALISSSSDIETVNYAMEKKNKYKLYSHSLNIAYYGIADKCHVSGELIYEALKGILTLKDQTGINNYELNVILNYLETTDLSENKKMEIEWIYLNVFDETNKPITIQRQIVENPEMIKELAHYAYKAKNDKKKDLTKAEENFATIAYKVLNDYLIVPGYDEKGNFNSKKFGKWIKTVIKNAKDDDREEITKHIIGKMLYNSFSDKNGLWIQKEIAEFINQKDNNDVRIGFRNAAYNAVGIVNCDGTGSAWLAKEEEYLKKAEELENYDFDLFAKSLKTLAKSFRSTANHEIESY